MKETRMKQKMRSHAAHVCRVALSAIICAAILLVSANFAGAQQKDKKNKNKNNTPADSSSPTSIMSDEQQIDYVISTMLGAWQVNDLEKLHQAYAEDVVVVSGNWAPPIIGWSNFSAMYQQQRAHMQQVRMDRSNTLTKVAGTFAWACYQWEFSSTIDGQVSAAQGQTTLIFQKQNGRWLITHNHTSLVQSTGAFTPVKPASAPPAAQPPQS
jgi:uncharacterized protein (TIGR02246 family)